MNYALIIDEVLDNTNQASENSKTLKMVKNDIKRILYEMHGKGETPKKLESFAIDKTGSTTETFADPDNINSDLNTGTLVIDAGNLEFVNTGDKLILNNQTGLLTFRIKGFGEFVPAPSGSMQNDFELKTYDSHDNLLQTETISFIDEDVLDNTYEIPINDLAGGRVELEFTVKDPNAEKVFINEVEWEVHTNSLQLPSTLFVPLEVAFFPTTTGSNPYESKEFFAEDYMKWIPNKISTGESIVFNPEDFVANVWWRTEQNINYDRKIGFYLEYVSGIWTLFYKPTFVGLITVYHSYFPTFDVTEASSVNMQEVFIDCLIAGVTLRQLDKLLLKSEGEIDVIKIKATIVRWAPRYASKLQEFAGQNKRKSETHVVKPNNILVDPGMNIL